MFIAPKTSRHSSQFGRTEHPYISVVNLSSVRPNRAGGWGTQTL